MRETSSDRLIVSLRQAATGQAMKPGPCTARTFPAVLGAAFPLAELTGRHASVLLNAWTEASPKMPSRSPERTRSTDWQPGSVGCGRRVSRHRGVLLPRGLDIREIGPTPSARAPAAA